MRAANEMAFSKAKKEDKESYKLLAMRLFRLGKSAYPNLSEAELEDKLQQKFKASVPESFRQVLRDSARTTALYSGQGHAKLRWKEVEILAEAEDRLSREQSETREASDFDYQTEVYVVDPSFSNVEPLKRRE